MDTFFIRLWISFCLVLLLSACQKPSADIACTIERQQIQVLAEASKTITAVYVKQGDLVKQGQNLLQLDNQQINAQLAQAEALLNAAKAQLALLEAGARVEEITAAKAHLAANQSQERNSQIEFQRIQRLREQGAASKAQWDNAKNALALAKANVDAARAQLAQYQNGSRVQQISAAKAQVKAQEAALNALKIQAARYTIKAPRDALVDFLPFHLGDQVSLGAPLVSLLVGQPYARAYLPEAVRAKVSLGQPFFVYVTGITSPLAGKLSQVRSYPAFTPYYALTGEDATHLSYRAEISLSGDVSALAAGLPCYATRQ